MAYNPPADIPITYANWGQRVGAYIIDMLPVIAGLIVVFILNLIFRNFIIAMLLWLIFAAGNVWWWVTNRLIATGNTGQSLGKRQLGIKLVSESTGQPIGAGQVFVRDLCHFVDGIICYVGFLFPLWDPKAQTLADKIAGTVVVPA